MTMDVATMVMSMILGFAIGEVVYWLIIRRLIDRLMYRPFTFKTQKNEKLVVMVFKDRVMVRKIKKKDLYITNNGRTWKIDENKNVMVYIEDSLKPV